MILLKGVNTKVLMLSATPVNNNLKDLRNQFYFISKGEENSFYENTGVKNIALTIKNAQTIFTHWADPEKKEVEIQKIFLKNWMPHFLNCWMN